MIDKDSIKVVKAANHLNIEIQVIKKFYNTELYKKLKSKYISNDDERYLWEGFNWKGVNAPTVQSIEDGWQYIKDLVGDNKCYLFFNKNSDEDATIISSGEDLDTILREVCWSEFYVTDTKGDYLVCYSHHDCLIGCGEVKAWFEQIPKS